MVLLGTVGVAEADATAASLAFFAAQLVVALTGGVIHVLFPLERAGASPEHESPPARRGA